MKEGNRWLVVVVFATAMAWVESSVVFYLRTMIDRIDPYQAIPMPLVSGISQAEMIREAATLVMLLAVGWLAGSTGRTRIAYTAIAFGVWDIFYYVFLRLICGWPHSVWNWDLLFLLPLPWWGPVLAPASIAALMVVGGTMTTQFEREDAKVWPSRRAWGASLCGALLALYVFMTDTIRLAPQGGEAVRNVLPTSFNWPFFLVALALMAGPVFELAWQLCQRKMISVQNINEGALE